MVLRDLSMLHCQCHGCWWPVNKRSQGISSHGIDSVPQTPGIYGTSLSDRRVNTLWPRQNGHHFADDIPALVQVMAWCCPGNKPLSEAIMISFPMHICVTGPQWVKFYTVLSTICSDVFIIVNIVGWMWLQMLEYEIEICGYYNNDYHFIYIIGLCLHGIGSGLSPVWCQTTIWTLTDLMSITILPSWTNFHEIWIEMINARQIFKKRI